MGNLEPRAVLNGAPAVERLEPTDLLTRASSLTPIIPVARCLMAVAYLIENRGASLLLKKRASGFFIFPKNDLPSINSGPERVEGNDLSAKGRISPKFFG